MQLSQLSGDEQGIEQGHRLVVEQLLRLRFGTLDEELTAIITSLLALPPQELTLLLLQLSQISRTELLVKFKQY